VRRPYNCETKRVTHAISVAVLRVTTTRARSLFASSSLSSIRANACQQIWFGCYVGALRPGEFNHSSMWAVRSAGRTLFTRASLSLPGGNSSALSLARRVSSMRRSPNALSCSNRGVSFERPPDWKRVKETNVQQRESYDERPRNILVRTMLCSAEIQPARLWK
jgi:hypothetical protein